jgi:hypothetical protein
VEDDEEKDEKPDEFDECKEEASDFFLFEKNENFILAALQTISSKQIHGNTKKKHTHAHTLRWYKTILKTCISSEHNSEVHSWCEKVRTLSL